MFRLLCANTFNNNGRKTKAVNYCESRDPDDGETLYIILIILVRLIFLSASIIGTVLKYVFSFMGL